MRWESKHRSENLLNNLGGYMSRAFICASCNKEVLPWREDTLRHDMRMTRDGTVGLRGRTEVKVCNKCYTTLKGWRQESELSQRKRIRLEYLHEDDVDIDTEDYYPTY